MEVLADGMVRSQNETTLHFALGGKLTYLPFKEGDHVEKGQTIAAVDTYVLQRQLTAALNAYRSTRDSFDQQNDNTADNYLNAQQANPYPYNYWNLAGINGDSRNVSISNMIKRLDDQAQAGLDNSVIQVEIANYALSLASIQAPFSGVITHMDVGSPGVMIGATTGFTVVDTDAYVFRANVAENDINFIAENSPVTVQLTGNDQKFEGIVSKIYPDKVALPTGENVYQVEIESDGMAKVAKYRQDGNVLMKNKYERTVVLVPNWLVLSKQHIWVKENGKPVLKNVTIGNTFGENVEVFGLTNEDVIVNPQGIVSTKYTIL
jgi:multidrug resistance efflux pump